jgi:anthranilate synthase component 1
MVVEELEGDTLTPISIFQRISGKKKFLLESSNKHEHSGRFSFIGVDPAFELKGVQQKTQITSKEQTELIIEHPLEVLKRKMPNQVDYQEIPFIGGPVGFVGYDVVRHYERIGQLPFDELHIPDVHFMFFEIVIIFDHVAEKVFFIGTPLQETTTKEELLEQVLKLKQEIEQPVKDIRTTDVRLSRFETSISKEDFIEKVKTAKEYIREGDIFQVVLSQRLSAELIGDPFQFYRRLRKENPSPYLYYLDFEDYLVIGASPESLIKVNERKVTTNPIAGTRPRGRNAELDQKLEQDLLQDEKELSEHRMLLDLGRNDLGRVSEFGSITIEKNMQVEKFKHVMHLVSEVSGSLKDSYTAIDALVACLPAGTVSGAPKIRAMEIINELEHVKRGVYSGAVGYLSANGNMDFALAIRTMLVKDNHAYIQAGAGIVYDSIPEKEYEETIHKLKAFLEDDDDFIN